MHSVRRKIDALTDARRGRLPSTEVVEPLQRVLLEWA